MFLVPKFDQNTLCQSDLSFAVTYPGCNYPTNIVAVIKIKLLSLSAI